MTVQRKTLKQPETLFMDDVQDYILYNTIEYFDDLIAKFLV